MHTIIGVLSYGAYKKEALENAKIQLKELCRPINDDEFMRSKTGYDYYVTFDVKGHKMAGKGRWGDFPVIERVDSIKGIELLVLWLKRLLYSVEIDDVILDIPSYKFKDTENPVCITNLYDSEGKEIRSFAHLEKALKGQNKETHVYVVPADVHYNQLIFDEKL